LLFGEKLDKIYLLLLFRKIRVDVLNLTIFLEN